MSQPLLPVALNLNDRPVLIVGGGKVARRKALAVLECGARLRVIASAAAQPFPPQTELCLRPYRAGDCKGMHLVFAATDDAGVNSNISAEAHSLGIWCNNVSGPNESDFHSAAAVRRAGITVGISTGGASPALARHVKERVEQSLGTEYEQLMEITDQAPIELQYRADFWQRALDGRVLELLRKGQKAKAITLIREFKQEIQEINHE
jgi:siroheme synthase-like protein